MKIWIHVRQKVLRTDVTDIMEYAVGILGGDPKHRHRNDDSVSDRLSYRYTTFLLVAFALLISTRQLVGLYKPVSVTKFIQTVFCSLSFNIRFTSDWAPIVLTLEKLSLTLKQRLWLTRLKFRGLVYTLLKCTGTASVYEPSRQSHGRMSLWTRRCLSLCNTTAFCVKRTFCDSLSFVVYSQQRSECAKQKAKFLDIRQNGKQCHR